jgi:hypothetical protein
MPKWLSLILVFLLAGRLTFGQSLSKEPTNVSVSLAGTWGFRLDPGNVGTAARWYDLNLPETVRLPGSTDENRKGFRNVSKPALDHLSRIWEYKGAAWYEREIDIPSRWNGLRVALFLERCHWETRVWLDGRQCGMQDSLCVPHLHELGIGLRAGKHRLTLRVDNSVKFDVGMDAHSITEQTQTNWNGVVGRIELQATPTVWISDLQTYPDFDHRSIRVKTTVTNESAKVVTVKANVLVSAGNVPFAKALTDARTVAPGARTELSVTVPIAKGVTAWSEFHPALCQARVSVVGDSSIRTVSRTFALRKIATRNRRLTLNNRNLFLRGTLECCIFPLTGYPPTDVASWRRELGIMKSYGLNHVRFHSWCPPEAAFEAADEMGFLFHVELPQWVGNVGQVPDRDRFIREEEDRILTAYGNHPSFGFLCMGNELTGDPSFLQVLVKAGQSEDPRHLYTPSTAWSQGASDDYRVVVVRGLHGPSTDADFRQEVASQPVPTVSHEVGQWCIFPRLSEIAKYTGVTRPRNFELVRDGLASHHLLDQAEAFTQASGKLSALLYKEEIEVLLRTAGHSGFQLLDLHDFPGQGTALVGILDPFWGSKDLISSKGFRRFCAPTVPLLRLAKRTFMAGETVTGQVQLAHYGASDLRETPKWKIAGEDGEVLYSGSWPTQSFKAGNLDDVGRIGVRLDNIRTATKLKVTVTVGPAENDWEIWVYPTRKSPEPGPDLLVTKSIDEALRGLEAGRKVLFLATRGSIANPVRGSFTPVFWSPVWFAAQPAKTMGILCDPHHPALSEFPTESHTNWQWYDLLQRSNAMVLDGTPSGFRPIVQVVDNFVDNRKLGNLIEARVGNGRLIVCSMNIWDDLETRPVARQLYESILSYMGSERFAPTATLTSGEIRSFLRPSRSSNLTTLGAKLIFADSEDLANGNMASNAIDDDPDTFWHTQWQPSETPYPHEIRIDLQKTVSLIGMSYTPRQDMENGRIGKYEVYVSDDPATWGEPVARGSFPPGDAVQTVTFLKPVKGRYLRFIALSELNGHPFAAIADLDVILP